MEIKHLSVLIALHLLFAFNWEGGGGGGVQRPSFKGPICQGLIWQLKGRFVQFHVCE